MVQAGYRWLDTSATFSRCALRFSILSIERLSLCERSFLA